METSTSKEFCLSDKIESCDTMNYCLDCEYVKEFIRLLKEEFKECVNWEELKAQLKGDKLL